MPRQRVIWLMTGSRMWDDQKFMDAFFRKYVVAGPQGDLVIHGYAAGADSVVDWMCLKYGVMCARVPYPKHFPGRSGGPVRNQIMLDMGRGMSGLGCAVRCVAWHDDPNFELPATHSGTGDMVRRCRRHGIRLTWCHHVERKKKEGGGVKCLVQEI